MAKLTSEEFLSSGTWVCPAGITKIIIFMCGGGGGAGGGNNGNDVSGGGAGSNTVFHCLSVIPGTSYPVVIGTGGAGATNGLGVVGTDTTFDTDAARAQGARRGGNFFSRGNGGSLNPRSRSWATGGGNLSDDGMPNGGYKGGIGTGSLYGGGGAGGRGNGGDGNNSGTGGSAAANSGAGGGGGEPTGGNGGSGHMLIVWGA